jgi:uncharacterized coiled-coil protein SlyX
MKTQVEIDKTVQQLEQLVRRLKSVLESKQSDEDQPVGRSSDSISSLPDWP